MDEFLVTLSQMLGIDQQTIAMLLPLLVIVCGSLGKLIPDSATGFLGILRKILKVIGLYTTNRVQPGITTTDVANAALSIPQVKKDALKK